ncbi:GNAT family N-acetyltransferase [Shewanella intestini]|uniref:GNAT family N-acetyltransferase n=2 Tax=Shewanellaceae TaxID=267890 RepID=A0ABS5I1T5_9GAMM|nr:GNAT family N-acetyltransferase [Shewanella intestini]MRG35575.1 GNAT family N-acetyltransferase [Shewanella sp. XMDDZSB0408]
MPLQATHLSMLLEYEQHNKAHLSRWEPKRSADYFTQEATLSRLNQAVTDTMSGKSVSLVGLNPQQSRIVCRCQFSNIVHGVFQACNLGYSISEQDQGKGLMFEMLNVAIDYMFNTYQLHRIMANYMPVNGRSQKLLNRLGFEQEGVAKAYLYIAGSWEDHVLTAKINR